MEKAAPSLVQCVMRRTRGMMGMAPPRGMCAATQVLVSRSAGDNQCGDEQQPGKAAWRGPVCEPAHLAASGCRRRDAHLLERPAATGAHIVPCAVIACVLGVTPAAVALGARGELRRQRREAELADAAIRTVFACVDYFDLPGDVEELLSSRSRWNSVASSAAVFRGCEDLDLGVETLADSASLCVLSRSREDFVADCEQLLPLLEHRSRISGENLFRLGEQRQMHAASRPSTSGRCSHTSSAVKLRIGATRRTSASVICQSTVCAERRAWLVGAKVYMRSLSTSR